MKAKKRPVLVSDLVRESKKPKRSDRPKANTREGRAEASQAYRFVSRHFHRTPERSTLNVIQLMKCLRRVSQNLWTTCREHGVVYATLDGVSRYLAWLAEVVAHSASQKTDK